MKKVIFFICVLSFVLTGFNQQERFVEQSDTEIFESDAVGVKPVIMKELKNASVSKGGIGVFLAHFAPEDDPDIRVIWYHNGRLIATGDRIKAYRDGRCVTLVIDDVMGADSGIYRVKIYNASGEAESEARLTVRE